MGHGGLQGHRVISWGQALLFWPGRHGALQVCHAQPPRRYVFFLLSLSMKWGGFPSWLGQKPHLSLFASLSMQAFQPLDASLLMAATQSVKYFRCLKCSNSYFSAALTSTESEYGNSSHSTFPDWCTPTLRCPKHPNSYFSAAYTPMEQRVWSFFMLYLSRLTPSALTYLKCLDS